MDPLPRSCPVMFVLDEHTDKGNLKCGKRIEAVPFVLLC